jgi:hypothetical protein
MPLSAPLILSTSLVTDMGADCVLPGLAVGFKGVVDGALFFRPCSNSYSRMRFWRSRSAFAARSAFMLRLAKK